MYKYAICSNIIRGLIMIRKVAVSYVSDYRVIGKVVVNYVVDYSVTG